MKKLLLLSVLLALSTNQLSAQSTREECAKSTIRQHFKETMNDYDSYAPVSYGTVDSLFSSPLDVEYIKSQAEATFKSRAEAGLSEIPITVDITDKIEEMEANSDLYKADAILKWKLYNIDRKLLISFLEDFKPKFIGWKIIHKYRAKNSYNATILYNKEFHLDKDLKRVTSIEDADE